MAVAVSGGADSFALLHALHEKKAPIVALTVDHGLRPEAADEAAKVAEWCAARSIPHETLIWSHAAHSREGGDLPPHDEVPDQAAPVRDERKTGNLQAKARTARYRLLCRACNRLGIEKMVTGHTADDQAETVFMRLRRGSGRGLAAMPMFREIAGGTGTPVTLFRPLIGTRRSETRDYAIAQGLPFSDDPSNEDERFERVRMRALLAALEQQDLITPRKLHWTSNAIGQLARSEKEAVLQLLEERSGLFYHPDGALRVHDWNAFGNDTQLILQMRAVEAVNGQTPGRRPAREPLEVMVKTGAFFGANIKDSGVEDRRDRLFFREPAALLGRADGAGGFDPIQVSPGEKHLYDRRFIVHVPETIQESTILRPLGALMPREIATSTLDRQRISTLPCLSHRDRLTHMPAAVKDFICKSLAGWKGAADFLDGVGTFTADSLLEERFTGRVIRF